MSDDPGTQGTGERRVNGASNAALLKPTEVADLCRCSVKTVMRAVVAGELEASQLARRGTWIVRANAIDEWLDRRSNRVRPPRPRPDIRRVEGDPADQPKRRRRAPRADGNGRLMA